MKITTSNHEVIPAKGIGYRDQFCTQFDQYLATQPSFVRGLHLILQGLAIICFVLPFIFGFIALYQTYIWATTGSLAQLGMSWVRFGLSCSLMVFPWGLDAMLLRAFPTNAFLQYAYGKVQKPVKFTTGIGAFFAGFGVMCAGGPGVATILPVIWQFVQSM